jgi:hypothetical protein
MTRPVFRHPGVIIAPCSRRLLAIITSVISSGAHSECLDAANPISDICGRSFALLRPEVVTLRF